MRPRPTHLTNRSSRPGASGRSVFSLAGLAFAWIAIFAGAGGPAKGDIVHHDNVSGTVLADVGITERYISPPDSCGFPGDGTQDTTRISYRVILPDTVFVGIELRERGGEIVGMIQSFTPSAPGVTYSRLFNGCIYQNISGRPLADGLYDVAVHAVVTNAPDEYFFFPLEIDRRLPAVLSLREASGTGVFSNGDTIVLELVADRPGYRIAPDFKNIDSDASPALTTVTDHGDGSYTIRHDISLGNTLGDRRDTGIPITITDLAGNSRTDRSARVCLLNHPPRPIYARVMTDGNVFKNGDTIRIETRWDSPNAPLTVSADFGNIDNHYQPALVTVTERSGNVFELAYPLSAQNTKLDYTDYRLRITVRDAGCGTAIDTSVVLQLDNQPPPRPVVDPVPTTTRTSTIAVKGSAPGSARVEVRRNNALLAGVTPEADSRFTIDVPLISSLNTLVLTGLDAVGNRSAPDTLRVTMEAPNAPQVNSVPATTHEESVTLTGHATNAVIVRVQRGTTTIGNDSTLVDGEFSITVPLIAGRNDLKVESLNSLNLAGTAATLTVFRITGAFVSVPSRFVAGTTVAAQFQIGLERTGRNVRVELWTLSGDLISVIEDGTSRDLYTLSWNGRDSNGRAVQAGPVLSRIDIDYMDGSKESMNRAFVVVTQ